MNYDDFIATKLTRSPATGLASVPPLHPSLFPHQRDLVTWALKRGRAAIFADTGLGKSRMQLEWARYAGKRVLILAPLAVAGQTAKEGDTLGIDVRVCREDADVIDGVNITNYDRVHKFDCSRFDAVVLDESSIIKHHTAKTLRTLLDAFAATPFKLCATATPSPNDYTELGTHAEFLGACSRTEMLSEFFCHDGGETQVWRLKGHARGAFWRWVSTWAAMLRKPSDLGYPNDGYDLPHLETVQHVLAADPETVKRAGLLFAEPARDLTERRNARRASLSKRVEECATLVNGDDLPWVVWCDLNDESGALTDAIRGAIEVRGSHDVDEKEERLAKFASGEARVIVSKPSICGWGLNWQHCNRMAFVGVTDSYEAFYQAVRRIWRFGQTRPCIVHVYASEVEGSVVANLERKARDAANMAEELTAETREAMRAEVRGATRTVNVYQPGTWRIPEWLISDAS
jgi:superfamily II DNA or RNA helicase